MWKDRAEFSVAILIAWIRLMPPLFADPGGLAEIVFAAGAVGEMLELAQPDHRFHVQHRLGDRGCGLLSRGKGEQAIRKLAMVRNRFCAASMPSSAAALSKSRHSE